MKTWNPRSSQITFGVEIEVSLSYEALREAQIQIGGYRRGVEIFADNPLNGFFAQSDSSIPHRPGYHGVEIVSPVLKGEEGLRRLMAAAEYLRTLGAKTEGSGLHVHIGVASVIGQAGAKSEEERAEFGRRLINLVITHEEALLASTGTARRKGNHYCRSIREGHTAKTAAAKKAAPRAEVCEMNRYHLLNLTPMGRPRNRTVEFRLWEATTDPILVAAYVQMALALAIKAASEEGVAKPPKTAYSNGRYKTCPQAYKELRLFVKYHGWMPAGAHLGWLLPYAEYWPQVKSALKAKAFSFAAEVGR